MVAGDLQYASRRGFAAPVLLPFQHQRHPVDGRGARLYQALHGVVLAVWRNVAGDVRQNINLISLAQGGQRRQHHAAGGPQPADDDFLAAGLFDQVHHAPILPDVDGGAIVHLQVRACLRHLLEYRPGEAFGVGRGQNGRHVEHLGGLGDAGGVIHQIGLVDRGNGHAEHVLQIDQQQQTVLGGQRLHITRLAAVGGGDCASAATGAAAALRPSIRANRVFSLLTP